MLCGTMVALQPNTTRSSSYDFCSLFLLVSSC